MKTIFIGPAGGGGKPNNGASVKNVHIIARLRELSNDLVVIDTERWKTNPIILIKLLSVILINPKSRYILSLNSVSANRLIRIIKILAPTASIIYWVIGGSFAKMVLNNKFKRSDYAGVDNIIVEGNSMRKDLLECGLCNVSVLPNFKPKVNIGEMKIRERNECVKFVFISRITPLKGCDLIFNAVNYLNSHGYSNRFSVYFYGPIDAVYEKPFRNQVKIYKNVSYCGFLDLRDPENYRTLAKFDAMLFPTIWQGEGCPGVVIDACYSGLPVLASDWNLNRDYVKNDITGILYQANDEHALMNAMKKCIDDPKQLERLRLGCMGHMDDFDIDRVLSVKNLKLNKIL